MEEGGPSETGTGLELWCGQCSCRWGRNVSGQPDARVLSLQKGWKAAPRGCMRQRLHADLCFDYVYSHFYFPC